MPKCQETAGFLFDHPCGRDSEHVCEVCGKLVCSRHVAKHDGKMKCSSCVRKALRKEKPHKAGMLRRGDFFDRSPYYYSQRRYHGFGFYGRGYWGSELIESDFTEADGAHMVAGDHGFEDDMGAS